MARRCAAALLAAAAATASAVTAAAAAAAAGAAAPRTTCRSAAQGGPPRTTCGAAAAGRAAQDSVLLQLAGIAAHRADTSGGSLAEGLSCEACAGVFRDIGGCEAQRSHDKVRLWELRHGPDFAGCAALGCDKLIWARCAATEHAMVSTTTCDDCADAFVANGGCETPYGDDEQWLRLENPAFATCRFQDCRAEIHQRCAPPRPRLIAQVALAAVTPGVVPTCQTCAEVFAAAGGCEAKLSGDAGFFEGLLKRPEFAGCGPQDCSAQIDERCTTAVTSTPPAAVGGSGGAADRCGVCIDAFAASGGCTWRGGVTALPGQCSGTGPRCGERVAGRCHAATGCSTAQEGDVCFDHVRWAMERGVVEHPEWYPALTQASSFEQFQMLLHLSGAHGCPAPCPAMELPCHTASRGEACWEHVLWAQTQGLAAQRDRFPSRLTLDSEFADVQAWLHQIHHGDCPRPCQ